MGQRALNQATNAAISAQLARFGMVAKRTTIHRSTIDGDTATVTALVADRTADRSQTAPS
jgi:hypothetical protein